MAEAGTSMSCGCLVESFIATEVKKYFSENYKGISEYKILKNIKGTHYLPYDIFLPDYNIFIEIQGIHHYQRISYWHKEIKDFEYQEEKDLLKKNYAENHGIFVEVDLRKILTSEDAINLILKYVKGADECKQV